MPKQYFVRLQTIDRLIRIKGTGPPRQLAGKLGISERALYDFLELMKDMGAPITYNKNRQSYMYKEDGGFEMLFKKYIEPR
jgi:predicted DNA-binding transcriptional regulator YafY